MRAAIGRYALTAGLLRRYQLTPALNCFFSDKTHDSRMPPMSYSLKMRFTQRSPYSDYLGQQNRVGRLML